jgi:hypothetical protein
MPAILRAMSQEPYDWMISVSGIESCTPSRDGNFLTTVLHAPNGERVLVDFHREAIGHVLQMLASAAGQAASRRDDDPEIPPPA